MAVATVLMLAGCVPPGTSLETSPLGGGLPVTTVEKTVTYRVNGDGLAAITWVTVDAGSVGQESATQQVLPFEKRVQFDEGIGISYTAFTLVAVGDQDTTNLSCIIRVDGEEVASQQSTGPFSTVSCSVSG
jgi:hypothetical protein